MIRDYKNIVYLESSLTNAKLLEKFIKSIGPFNISYYTRGSDGIEAINQLLPDLILLDLSLRDMSGYDVLITLRNNNKTKQIPIVCIAANTMQTDIVEAKSRGFTAYITKPINLHVFNAVIKRLLIHSPKVQRMFN